MAERAGPGGGGAMLVMDSSGRIVEVPSGAGDEFMDEGYFMHGDMRVNISADAEAPIQIRDEVRSWVVASGSTLRSVLQEWADQEGWDLVWATSREFPIEASAVFRGRFVDVASAVVRNFARATPIPHAKFYNGNRVLVITTNE
jgi:hypothetical protein